MNEMSFDNTSATELMDKKIAAIGGWRAITLSKIRKLIKDAVPDITEDCKWVKPSNPSGVPVWSYEGIICTGESYKTSVKLTFAKGASLQDSANLFNSSLEGSTRRAIDIHEGEEIDANAFKSLIREAANFNASTKNAKRK